MNILKKYTTLIFVLTQLVSCNHFNDIPFKSDAKIQIDGFFKEKDWGNAKVTDITSSTTLYYIEDESNLFIGIRNKDSINRYVDLYIDNDSIGTINLHASMQLGERLLQNNDWNDTIPAWNWGNNSDWESNKVKLVNHHENISFHESIDFYEGFEFKILKSKIKSKENRIRIEIKEFLGRADNIDYPSDSERYSKENWNKIILK